MKAVVFALSLLAIATSAFAGSAVYQSSDHFTLPEVRDSFYCQSVSASWNATNASSAFNSEMADDIPGFSGSAVSQVTMYVAEWGGGWVDPQSFTFNFYVGVCPPNMTADATYTINWADLTPTLVYSGGWYVYQITGNLPSSYTIGAATSLGGFSNNNWGQNAPYCGLVVCDVPNGCGEGYWAGDFWGAPRWTPFSFYFGYTWDVAYCLGGGPTPAKSSSWGQIRGLYK
jgi:hypothetical protein